MWFFTGRAFQRSHIAASGYELLVPATGSFSTFVVFLAVFLGADRAQIGSLLVPNSWVPILPTSRALRGECRLPHNFGFFVFAHEYILGLEPWCIHLWNLYDNRGGALFLGSSFRNLAEVTLTLNAVMNSFLIFASRSVILSGTES